MTNEIRGGRGAGRPSERPTKADKKEQARIEREEIRRQMAARRRNRLIGLVAGLVAAGVVLLVLVTSGGGGGAGDTSPSSGPGALPGLLTTPGPWDNNTAQLAERVAAINLPPEGNSAGHHHARLWVYVSGAAYPVPADVGLSSTFGAALHTHDASGEIHVESTDPAFAATLGQFFDVWGVRLSSTCIGGNCAGGALELRAYVNGTPYDGDPRQIPLDDQSAIVLVFGTKDQVPDPIPSAMGPTGP